MRPTNAPYRVMATALMDIMDTVGQWAAIMGGVSGMAVAMAGVAATGYECSLPRYFCFSSLKLAFVSFKG